MELESIIPSKAIQSQKDMHGMYLVTSRICHKIQDVFIFNSIHFDERTRGGSSLWLNSTATELEITLLYIYF